MAQLNILGAQRVKALVDFLEQQKRCEINSLPHRHNETIIKRIQDSILIAGMTYNEIETLWRKAQDEYNAGLRDATKAFDVKRAEIEAKYKEKANRLWLCETLEEAKNIVGIE